MAIRQPAGTALVQEVDVFNEQAEERDDDLEDKQDRDGVIDRSGGVKSLSSFRSLLVQRKLSGGSCQYSVTHVHNQEDQTFMMMNVNEVN